MDPALTRHLGLFDYLRERLAIAGTPDDCVAQVRAAEAAGVTQLMFTVSLAADRARRGAVRQGSAAAARLAGRHLG
jgi:alkanesulfonate monooxygenase SsuD/methylene tetrahydromethanopterin reductase-like flavin-dependent oxidoreductase (luciferase family)